MKEMLHVSALLSIQFMLSGCSTPYMIDRGRDAKDIVTVTIGNSFGAKARLGPLHAGLYAGTDLAGLRAGQIESSFSAIDWSTLSDTDCTIFSEESYRPQGMPIAEQRGKLFDSVGLLGVSIGMPSFSQSGRDFGQHLPYFTQCEVAAGLLGGLRFGINPGELLDFILGWTTVDIFSDDVATDNQNGSNQASQAIGAPAPLPGR